MNCKKLSGIYLVIVICISIGAPANAQDKQIVVIDRVALTARGEVLTAQDPLAIELSEQQLDEAGRNGFYIGMAIAEGQTLPGPGKDKICASLNRGELGPCGIGVLFSVERNRNASLAYQGFEIARSNPIFSRARTAPAVRFRRPSDSVFYKLGFDIGLAAAGSDTLPGPGKDRTRDSLDATLRPGFSAAVSLALEENRKVASGTTSEAGSGPVDRANTPEAGSGPADRAVSNEIRCRGYSHPGGSAFVYFTIDSRPSPTGETLVTMEIAYNPGWRPAGNRGEGLSPGDCAWADRPIDANGPYRIRFETVANAQLKQALNGSQVDRSVKAAENYPDATTIPIYLKGDDNYWTFSGIRREGDHFVAAGHGFWRPAVAIGNVPGSPTAPARRHTVPKP